VKTVIVVVVVAANEGDEEDIPFIQVISTSSWAHFTCKVKAIKEYHGGGRNPLLPLLLYFLAICTYCCCYVY